MKRNESERGWQWTWKGDESENKRGWKWKWKRIKWKEKKKWKGMKVRLEGDESESEMGWKWKWGATWPPAAQALPPHLRVQDCHRSPSACNIWYCFMISSFHIILDIIFGNNNMVEYNFAEKSKWCKGLRPYVATWWSEGYIGDYWNDLNSRYKV